MEQNYTVLGKMPYLNKAMLGEVLGKSGENLNYWSKRLAEKGELIILKKGVYTTRRYLLSLEKNPALREAYYEYLANILRYPSYLSLEYALAKYGLIPEGVYSLTSVTLKSSRVFRNDLGNFIYRSVREELFFGFESYEFEGKRVKMATPAKALFDWLYFMKGNQASDLRVNWEVLSSKEREEFSELISRYGLSRMKTFLKRLKW